MSKPHFVPINSFVSLWREEPLSRLSRQRWDCRKSNRTGRDGLTRRRDRFRSPETDRLACLGKKPSHAGRTELAPGRDPRVSDGKWVVRGRQRPVGEALRASWIVISGAHEFCQYPGRPWTRTETFVAADTCLLPVAGTVLSPRSSRTGFTGLAANDQWP